MNTSNKILQTTPILFKAPICKTIRPRTPLAINPASFSPASLSYLSHSLSKQQIKEVRED